MDLKPVKHNWTYSGHNYENSGYVIGKDKQECTDTIEIILKKDLKNSDEDVERSKIDIDWQR